jgi:DNA polymerase (family 10)
MDFEKVLEYAKKNNKILEIDARKDRLDLDDSKIKLAKEYDVKMVINSYAENKNELNNIKYGLNQARRGWAEREDIINSQNNLF